MTGRTGPAPDARNDYALALSDVEAARYRRMAESAYQREAMQWTAAGSSRARSSPRWDADRAQSRS